MYGYAMRYLRAEQCCSPFGDNDKGVIMQFQHYRVLVIERDSARFSTSWALLQHAGYEVIIATDGITGWQYAFIHYPALIVLDLDVPAMDGFQVLMHLKHTPATSRIPVVLLTDRTWAREWHLAVKLGANLCVCKDQCCGSSVREQWFITMLQRMMRIHEQPAPPARASETLPHTTTAYLDARQSHAVPGRMTMYRVARAPYAHETGHNMPDEPPVLYEREVGSPG